MNNTHISINTAEFRQFKLWLHDAAGIDLKETKMKLVEGRLDIISVLACQKYCFRYP